MMLPFLVKHPEDHAVLEASARSLGIAMQITNILRDVGQDLRELGRVYLPETALSAYSLSRDDLTADVPPEGYALLLEDLMETAESLYTEGFDGIGRLPTQVRKGIYAAARMYREIMNEVRARGYDNLTQRAYVPLPRKLRLLLQDDYARRKQRVKGRG